MQLYVGQSEYILSKLKLFCFAVPNKSKGNFLQGSTSRRIPPNHPNSVRFVTTNFFVPNGFIEIFYVKF